MNKQDHHASSKASQGMANPCPLWGVLLRKFAIGKISAVKSGANSQDMLGLQSLGTIGASERQLPQRRMQETLRRLIVPSALEDSLPPAPKGRGTTNQQDFRLLAVTASHVDSGIGRE